MNKNLMPEVAGLLGVELGEELIIENKDRKESVVLAMDGFHVIQPNNVVGPDHGKLLSKVLQGLYTVKKIPWEPKKGDIFYYPGVNDGKVYTTIWLNTSMGYALKVLGMVYRTQAEAEANLSKDYEWLTGEPLSSC